MSLIHCVVAFMLFTIVGAPAYAVCADPEGEAGKIIYNEDHNIAQLCNGTQWLAWGSGASDQLWQVSGTAAFYIDGKVGIGTSQPQAGLDIVSTNQGFLPPRMTSAQRAAIAEPVDGLIVFDTDLEALSLYAGGEWTSLYASPPVTIVSARYSTNNTVSNGNFPTSWNFSSGTSAPFLFDGSTGGTSVNFQDDICAIELSEVATVVSFVPSGSWAHIAWAYSVNGSSWTRVQSPQTAHTPGTSIPLGVQAKYIGIGTGNGSGACSEISVSAM